MILDDVAGVEVIRRARGLLNFVGDQSRALCDLCFVATISAQSGC
jgi:hypothetical protein